MSKVTVPEAERKPAVAPVDLAEVARIQAQKRQAEQAAAKAKAAAEAKADAAAKGKAQAKKAEAETKTKAKDEAEKKAKIPAREWGQVAKGQGNKAPACEK